PRQVGWVSAFTRVFIVVVVSMVRCSLFGRCLLLVAGGVSRTRPPAGRWSLHRAPLRAGPRRYARRARVRGGGPKPGSSRTRPDGAYAPGRLHGDAGRARRSPRRRG